MTVEASAPGKLILLGEYAVLEGAPALVLAVDRRARVRLAADLTDRSGEASRGANRHPIDLRVESLAPDRYVAHGTIDGHHPRWHEPADAEARMALVTAVLEARLAAAPDEFAAKLSSLRATIETIDFFQQDSGRYGDKLGLGSSAAVTVALAAALDVATGGAGVERNADGLGYLLALHRRFQGGRGSGLDLAASLFGGVIEYRLPVGDGAPAAQASPAALPAGLCWTGVFTGRGASTSDFLARLEAWRCDNTAAYREAMRSLAGLAEQGVALAASGDLDGLLACVGDYAGCLAALGESSGLDIVSEEHRELRQCAERAGVVYKPCGAGGGDLGIAMAREEAALNDFRGIATQYGYQPMALAVATEGLQLTWLE